VTYNTIMVQFDIDAPAAPRLDFAWDIARRYEASLIGFAAAEAFLSYRETWMAARPERQCACRSKTSKIG